METMVIGQRSVWDHYNRQMTWKELCAEVDGGASGLRFVQADADARKNIGESDEFVMRSAKFLSFAEPLAALRERNW
jgi:hypothetical protein